MLTDTFQRKKGEEVEEETLRGSEQTHAYWLIYDIPTDFPLSVVVPLH